MSKDQTRVRKCLSAMRVQKEGRLVANDERKSYFICLKMLGILPPPPKSDFQSWQFYSPGVQRRLSSKLYTPKCLHDILISSHATSCEHGTLYFAYYHRHLTLLFEIFLNLAHQVLKGGEKALIAVYPKPQKFYNEKNKQLWDKVFSEYQKLDLPEQIAGHYWNPTDFKSDQNLSVLEELDWDRDGKTLDSIDTLFFSIYSCYPWEINVKQRWFQTQNDYNEAVAGEQFKNSKLSMAYFNGFNDSTTSYPDKQLKILKGDLNPHDNSANKQLLIQDISYQPRRFDKKPPGFAQNTRQITGQISYKLFDKKEGILRLCPITKNQSLLVYGAKSKKSHYISIPERQTKKIPVDFRNSYNSLLPHVLFAQTLDQSLKFKDYLVNSWMEASHNAMHNNFGLILMNPVYSITSLIFFPYHSWIDAQLQIKIRKANVPSEYNDLKLVLTKNYLASSSSIKGVLRTAFEKLSINPDYSMKSVAQFNLSGLRVDSETVGYYPIFEWITPPYYQKNTNRKVVNAQQISAAFLSQDYLLTRNSKIRDSLTLNEAYEKYFQFYRSRYSFFDDLKLVNPALRFTANHNYQVGSSPKDINTILADDASNIPQYINQVLDDYLGINSVARKAQDQMIPRKMKAVGLHQGYPKYVETGPSSDQQDEEQERLQLRKVLDSSIQLYVSYPVDAPNKTHEVVIRPKNIIDLLKEIIKSNIQVSQHEFEDLQRYIKDGISIYNISIFGKANLADICPKCADSKKLYLSLGGKLRNASPKLWKYLHIKTLNKVLFDSKVEHKIHCIYQKLELIPNPDFLDYRFVRGAEEIQINIINKAGKSNKFVRIDAESYSVQNNSLQSVLSKKYKNFKTSFDFFKIFDVNHEKDSNYFDHYLYKHLKGAFIVNDVVTEFSFDIPTFQRLLRLDITVHAERDQLGKVTRVNVSVEDRDYEKKLKFYEISYELLENVLENKAGIDFQQ